MQVESWRYELHPCMHVHVLAEGGDHGAHIPSVAIAVRAHPSMMQTFACDLAPKPLDAGATGATPLWWTRALHCLWCLFLLFM